MSASALILFSIQRKMTKKKTHLLWDMKWVNGILAMLFWWWLIEKLFLPHFTTLFVVSQLASIDIPDEIQVNVELYNIITIMSWTSMFNWATYISRDTSPIIGPDDGRNIAIYISKRSLIKHTCSWRDKLIVLWTLNRKA